MRRELLTLACLLMMAALCTAFAQQAAATATQQDQQDQSEELRVPQVPQPAADFIPTGKWGMGTTKMHIDAAKSGDCTHSLLAEHEVCKDRREARATRTPSAASADDLASRAAASEDYGHSVQYMAAKVYYPESDQEVAEIVAEARQSKQRLTVRATGHSTDGQSQCCDCAVLDMRNMNGVREVTADYVYVEAGAALDVAYQALAPFGKTTTAQTDWPGLTVGGVLSGSGGLGPWLLVAGQLSESVLELTVVTGQGEVVTASPSEREELFNATLGGLGQFSVITAVKLRAVDIPGSKIRVYHVYQTLEQVFEGFDTAFADQADPLVGLPFQQLEAFPVLNFPGTGAASGYPPDFFLPALPVGSWVSILEYGVFFEPGNEPDNQALFDYFPHVNGTEIYSDMDYFDWIYRLEFVFRFLLPSAQFNYAWHMPHPWLEVFVPYEEAEQYVLDLFATTPPGDTPLYSVQGLFPMFSPERKRTFQPMPDSPSDRLLYVGLLRQVDLGSTPEVFVENARLTEVNRVQRLKAKDAGAAYYLTSTLPADRDEFCAQPGFDCQEYTRIKYQQDPHTLFQPLLSSMLLQRNDLLNGVDCQFKNTL